MKAAITLCLGLGLAVLAGCAYRGEIDDAFEWLDVGYENRDTGLPFMLLEPLLRNLHDDPRWAAFLEKMGLPH